MGRQSLASRLGMFSRWAWRDLAIWTAATLFGVAFFVLAMKGQVGRAGDTPVYVELAAGVLRGHGFQLGGVPSATYPPLYPVFLAPFVELGMEYSVALVVAQCMLAGLGAVAAARTADRLFGSTAGSLAGLGVAFSPQLAFWAAYPLSDVLGSVLLMWGVAAAAGAWMPGRTGRARPAAFGAGILFGAAGLARPLSLSLALPAIVWLAVVPAPAGAGVPSTAGEGSDDAGGDPQQRSWVRQAAARLALGGIVFIGIAVALTPWTIRNAREFGGFYPLSTRNGWQLIQAIEWNEVGRGTVGVDVTYPPEADGLGEAEADRVLTSLAWERIRHDPGHFVANGFRKVRLLWMPTAPGLGTGSLAMGIHFDLVALLALGALVQRGMRRQGALFWAMAAGGSLGVAATILDPDYRYRLPILLVLMVPAAATLAKAVGTERG